MNVSLKSHQDFTAFISEQRLLLDPLYAVSNLGLPDCWIAAGFIRNAIWDHLHDKPLRHPAGDVDVVYFDKEDASEARDRHLEAELRSALPKFDWSVKNQARMHLTNGDAPYSCTSDAMMNWPETCTAIGARLRDAQVERLAPFGLDDLLGLCVRPTPAFHHKLHIYRKRILTKRWADRWPRLKVFDLF